MLGNVVQNSIIFGTGILISNPIRKILPLGLQGIAHCQPILIPKVRSHVAGLPMITQ